MSGRILIVEDEPSLVLTLTDRLRAEGYEVESAETGDEGARRAREGSFDLRSCSTSRCRAGTASTSLRDLRQQRVDDADPDADRARPGGRPRGRASSWAPTTT